MGKNSILATASSKVLLVGPVPVSGATWKRVLNHAAESKIIAVDGGLDQCLKHNLKVDLVMGDFDSTRLTEAELKKLGLKCLRFVQDKDRSDLGLALDFICTWNSSRGPACSVYSVGFLGGDEAHHLASVLEFSVASVRLKLIHCFSDSSDLVYLSAHSGMFQVNVSRGQNISAFSLDQSDHGLTLDGFKYNLKNGKLKFPSHGLNNQAYRNRVRIIVEKGRICIVIRKI